MRAMALTESERSAFVKAAEVLEAGEACMLRRRLALGLWDPEAKVLPALAWPGSGELEELGRYELGALAAGLSREKRRRLWKEYGPLKRGGGWLGRERLSKFEAASLSTCLAAPGQGTLPFLHRAGLHRLLRLRAPADETGREAWMATAPSQFRFFLRLANCFHAEEMSEES